MQLNDSRTLAEEDNIQRRECEGDSVCASEFEMDHFSVSVRRRTFVCVCVCVCVSHYELYFCSVAVMAASVCESVSAVLDAFFPPRACSRDPPFSANVTSREGGAHDKRKTTTTIIIIKKKDTNAKQN